MTEGSGSGSIPLTNGSGSIPLTNGSGSKKCKNIRIRGIRIPIQIRNTESTVPYLRLQLQVADPHPVPYQCSYQCDGNLRPLVNRSSRAPFSASRTPLWAFTALMALILSLYCFWIFTLKRIRIQLFTLMRIRIQLPIIMRIWIRNPGTVLKNWPNWVLNKRLKKMC